MAIPVHVTFHGLPGQPALEDLCRRQARELARLAGGPEAIRACMVVLFEPQRRDVRGELFEVRVELDLPGGPVLARRSPRETQQHERAELAIREAFELARHRLEHHLEQRAEDRGVRPPGRRAGPPLPGSARSASGAGT